MKSLKVFTATPYDILIGNGLLPSIGKRVSGLSKTVEKVLLVSDDNVFPLYGEVVKNSLMSEGLEVSTFIIKAGEDSKSIPSFTSALEQMAVSGFKRSDFVLALGGGVVGDLAGFVASAYMRGVDVIEVPTTLLAMVDSSVGGKTAVNLSVGKNLVGAFHEPALVVSDIDVLDTLNPYNIECGLGELAKYACLIGGNFVDLISAKLDYTNLEEIVYLSCKYKASIVEDDERESGKRKLLNLGHTFGHAYERLSGFTRSHGECVAMGLFDSIRISNKLGLLSDEKATSSVDFLSGLGFKMASGYNCDEVIARVAQDKKCLANGVIDFVTMRDFGLCEITAISMEKLGDLYRER